MRKFHINCKENHKPALFIFVIFVFSKFYQNIFPMIDSKRYFPVKKKEFELSIINVFQYLNLKSKFVKEKRENVQLNLSTQVIPGCNPIPLGNK